MNKRTSLQFLCLLGTACAMFGCNSDKENTETTATTTYRPSESTTAEKQGKQPALIVSALSKQVICETVDGDTRLQYRVKFSDKLHFGVSKDRKFDTHAPVAMHITKSEVRAFSVGDSAQFCFHFDNKNTADVSVDFSHRVM